MADKSEYVNPDNPAVDEEYYDQSRHEGRLTMAIIGCHPERAKGLAITETVEMAIIHGVVTGLTEAKQLTDDKTGVKFDSWGLTGRFEAINLETGVVFRGGVIYLPSGFQDQGIAAIRSQLSVNPAIAEVQFGFEFHARPDKNPTGYSWCAFPLVPTRKVDDPLALQRDRVLLAYRNRDQRRLAAPGLLKDVAG